MRSLKLSHGVSVLEIKVGGLVNKDELQEEASKFTGDVLPIIVICQFSADC